MFTFQETETKHPSEWESKDRAAWTSVTRNETLSLRSLMFTSSGDRKCSLYNSLIQLLSFAVTFWHTMRRDKDGVSERPPRSAWMPVLISVQPLCTPTLWVGCHVTWLNVYVFISHKERPWVIRLSLSALTETIRTLCITLHQDAVRLVRRRTCRLNLDEEKTFGCQISPIYSSTLPLSPLTLTHFLSNSTFFLPHSHCS